MSYKTSKLALAITVAASTFAMSASAEMINNGYLRLGIGKTDGGDFAPAGTGGWAGNRLGRENAYGEHTFGWEGDVADGVNFIAKGTVNYLNQSTATVTDTLGSADVSETVDLFNVNTEMKEAWAGVGTDFGRVWAGRRFYNRDDIHILDFWFRDMTGDGIGIEGVDVGVGKLSVAKIDALYTDQVSSYDIDLSGIAVGNKKSLSVGALVHQATSEGKAAGLDAGNALRVQYTDDDFMGGWLKLYAAHGRDSASSLVPAWTAGNGSDMTRFVARSFTPIGDNWEAEAYAVHQTGSEDWMKWTGMGIRPVYQVDDNWAYAVDVGVHKNNDGVGKELAVSPIYTFGNFGFWSRPQLRAIAKYAESPNGDDNVSVGLQFETWY